MTMNLWKLDKIKNLEYISDIDKVVELIREGKLVSLTIKDKFEYGTTPNSSFESVFSEKGVSLIYVDDDHPVLVSNNSIVSNFMSPKYYKEHEKEIKEAYEYYFVHCDHNFITIPSFAFSDELLDLLIERKADYLNILDVELTDEQIKKLQSNFINASVRKNGKFIDVSSNYVLPHITPERIENDNDFILSITDLKEANLDNVKYFRENTEFEVLKSDIDDDEKESYEAIKDLLEHLSKSGKHFKVRFRVQSRRIFKEVFNGERFDNVDIFIRNDLYDYPYYEYLEEEKKLDELVEPIKNANLSPLEKYLAVYNIVKNFKPYKESPNQLEDSRYIRYILNNEYMVCVGYAKLLQVLCDKVGIRVNDLSVEVDVSYDKKKDGENPILQEKIVEPGGHARCMVSIDDDKWNVHGVYVADPTWDNELSENRLNHALITFSKYGTGKRMIWLSVYEPILDINSFDDFNKQVNYLLKRMMEEVRENNDYYYSDYLSYEEQARMGGDEVYKEKMVDKVILLASYRKVIKNILGVLSCEPIKDFVKRLEVCKKEEEFENLLSDIGNYLLTRVNQPISNETLIQASVNGTAILKGLNEEKKEEEYERTRKQFYDREMEMFPYQVEDADELGWKTR